MNAPSLRLRGSNATLHPNFNISRDIPNAVVYERHHIIQRIDALIVLPSSPGSFCEFGDWASAPEICKKMLVLVDSQHEGQVNYINEGVTKFAASNGAQVEYCDYENFQQAFDKCERFLELMAASLRIESLYGRVRR